MKILYIGTDRFQAAEFQLYIERHVKGFMLEVYTNVKAGIDHCKLNHPDYVFTDYHSGIDGAVHIKHHKDIAGLVTKTLEGENGK